MAVNTYKEDEKVSDVSNIKTLLRTVSYLREYKVQTALAIIMILMVPHAGHSIAATSPTRM